MSRILKTGLLLALVFGVVWLAVIIWWQESHTLPTGVDIGLYLFALPLALIAAGWAGARIIRARREAKAAPAPAAAPSGEPEAAPVADLARLVVLASTARAALGGDPASIHAALAKHQRPELDASLKNARGFPIFSGRAAHLDTDTLREAASAAAGPGSALSGGCLRAAALLAEVVETLSQEARALVLGSGTPRRDEDWPQLQLELLLPADWPQAARTHTLDRARAAAVWVPGRIDARVHNAADALASDGLLRQLAQEPLDKTSAALRLVAAADSYIDAGVVQDWDAEGKLVSTANPQGRVPGEAAAGLLLDLALGAPSAIQDPAPPRDPPIGAVALTLSPTARRSTEADARGASGEPILAELTERFLQQQGQRADGIRTMVSDADHRGSRPLEAAGLAGALFPALDPNQDCLSIGAACGYTGAAAHLLTLAIAGETCAQTDAPVLAVMTQDPALRTLALVSRPIRPTA
ncbi:hypothetical protein [Achromobacter agilis]|uniref:Beta-ketoacyl synthase N-terminal domain-containing protein n=1 Tax=Achromobacter agilis TaxID=1353888 RepID=A0A446C9B0_9BURK|nr:hypothetical protein [Achromobacter agilis]SSW64497.1 hypothetical protein AGI3411_01595 [Achromobacter agilis]